MNILKECPVVQES